MLHKTKENQKAVMSNSLIKASYSLSLAEKRLILLALGEVKQSEEIDIETWYSANVIDYANLCGVTSPTAYEALKEATEILFQRYVVVKEGKTTTKFRWISAIRYVEGANRVEVRWSQEIIPYISELRSQYTRLNLTEALKITSTASIRLYEFVKQYEFRGNKENIVFVNVKELQDILDTPTSCREFKFFKRDILKKAILDLGGTKKQLVDIELLEGGKYRKKEGRLITHIAFRLKF